jgi:hypothetical protein
MPLDDAWLDLSALGGSIPLQEAVQRCLAAIDHVHRFPPVTHPIPILVDSELGAAGRYVIESGNERILIRPDPHGLTTTILHELGHVFDHYAAGGGGRLLTDDPTMKLSSWWRAVASSYAYSRLRLTMLEHPLPTVKVRASYLLHPRELFARCYAQYITVKSEDEVLAEDLAVYPIIDSATVILPWYWTDPDFADIFDALDRFMEADGWQHQSG